MPHAASRWDIIVVGAGHNGLTAGALLARAGLATLVVERRDVIGGCCVTEEIAPGCRASTTSYIASMLRPEVMTRADWRRTAVSSRRDAAVVGGSHDGLVAGWLA